MNNIIRFEDFSDLHESQESQELNHFEQTCLEEGIQFMDFESINENYDDSDEYEYIYEEDAAGAPVKKKKGGFFKKIGKILGKVAGSAIKNIAGPILKNLGIPGGGAIAGILDKVGAGLSKIKPKGDQKIGQAAKDVPELKQVSDVFKGTLDKVIKDVTAKGPEALFSKANRESVLNLAAIVQTMGQTVASATKEAGVPPKPGSVPPPKTA